MIPLSMVVLHEFANGLSEVALIDTSVTRRKRHVPSLPVESPQCCGSTRGSGCTLTAFAVSQEHRAN